MRAGRHCVGGGARPVAVLPSEQDHNPPSHHLWRTYQSQAAQAPSLIRREARSGSSEGWGGGPTGAPAAGWCRRLGCRARRSLARAVHRCATLRRLAGVGWAQKAGGPPLGAGAGGARAAPLANAGGADCQAWEFHDSTMCMTWPPKHPTTQFTAPRPPIPQPLRPRASPALRPSPTTIPLSPLDSGGAPSPCCNRRLLRAKPGIPMRQWRCTPGNPAGTS